MRYTNMITYKNTYRTLPLQPAVSEKAREERQRNYQQMVKRDNRKKTVNRVVKGLKTVVITIALVVAGVLAASVFGLI